MFIFETKNQILYNGIDEKTKLDLANHLSKKDQNKIFCLYASNSEFLSNEDILDTNSNCVAFYSYTVNSKLLDQFIIDRHLEMENGYSKPWIPIAGIRKGSLMIGENQESMVIYDVIKGTKKYE